jgi:hypothetical protein
MKILPLILLLSTVAISNHRLEAAQSCQDPTTVIALLQLKSALYEYDMNLTEVLFGKRQPAKSITRRIDRIEQLVSSISANAESESSQSRLSNFVRDLKKLTSTTDRVIARPEIFKAFHSHSNSLSHQLAELQSGYMMMTDSLWDSQSSDLETAMVIWHQINRLKEWRYSLLQLQAAMWLKVSTNIDEQQLIEDQKNYAQQFKAVTAGLLHGDRELGLIAVKDRFIKVALNDVEAKFAAAESSLNEVIRLHGELGASNELLLQHKDLTERQLFRVERLLDTARQSCDLLD